MQRRPLWCTLNLRTSLTRIYERVRKQKQIRDIINIKRNEIYILASFSSSALNFIVSIASNIYLRDISLKS